MGNVKLPLLFSPPVSVFSPCYTIFIMQFTKNQLAIMFGVGFVAVVGLLILTGILPGLNKNPGTGVAGLPKINVSLNFWTFGDTESAFRTAVAAFHTANPNAEVKVRSFGDFSSYNRALIDALAAGEGPDVVTVRSTDLPNMVNKLTPAPQTLLTLQAVRGTFPQVVEQDFIQNGSVYALPLSVDTLALFYNRDFLDAEGITPPATWDDFTASAPKLLKKSPQDARVTRGGVAFGSSKTVPEASDILSLLLIQSGVQMTSPDFRSATFASGNAGAAALSFYTQFANPQSKSYTWNDGVGNAYDAFSQEKVAMMFGYASSIPDLKKRNAFLNFGIAEAPQPKDTQKPISYPNYVGYGVSRQTKNADVAWNFVSSLSLEANARAYLTATGKPPALRSLLGEYRADPMLGVFATQALTARSWPQADADAVRSIFSRAIDVVTSNATTPATALRAAQEQITTLMVR